MAASFLDRHGQQWDIAFTFGLIDRVKRETTREGRPGIDVAKAMEDNAALSRVLFGDMGRTLVEVLYAVCEDQIAERDISPEQWADLFDGLTIERATSGFLEGIADFFPRSRVGKAIREDTPKMLAEMDDKLIRDLRRKRPGGSGGSAKNSPDSAESGPTGST